MFTKTLLIVALLISSPAIAHAEQRVLVYGDSNTWGWKPVPDGKPVPRYSDDQRWPGVMQAALGRDYAVTVNGLLGRTLDADLAEGIGQLKGQDHNGMRRLGLALAEAGPVNLLVVMLGTNDLIVDLNRTPRQIAGSLAKLVKIANAGTIAYQSPSAPRILIVVPPPLDDTSRTPFKALFTPGSIKKSRALAAEYERAGLALGVPVINAGKFVESDGIDGLHLSAEAHRRLGDAIAREVRKISFTGDST